MGLLDNEVDDIVATIQQPPTDWRLIVATILGTILVATVGVVWYAHSLATPATPPAPQAFVSSNRREIDQKIKGNPKSMIYHLQGCLSYNNLSPENIEWFKTEEDAEDAGYRKAYNCP